MQPLSLIVVCIILLCPPLLRGDIESNDGTCACGGRRDSVLGPSLIKDSSQSSSDVNDDGHNLVSEGPHIEKTSDQGGNNLNLGADNVILTEQSNLKMNMDNMVFIDGGTFFMGSDNKLIPSDGEGPRRIVTLHDFMIDRFVGNIMQFFHPLFFLGILQD